MRPITKSKYKPSSYIFDPYSSAKDELISALGSYCSYCERPGYFSAIDVEHIRDKNTYPNRKLLWRNFLLGCKNCNPIKSTNSILNMFFPTVHNTFKIFIYDRHGGVSVNQAVLGSEVDEIKAKNLIELVGLDRTPGHPKYSNKDKRWSERKDVYMLAEKYLDKYHHELIDPDTIIDLALAKGFWSIWMSVFADKVEIVDLLVERFTGTKI
ncbi:HNH endonuclease [Microbulbifer sp. THAF38]|uniref:HNH endonuclease n=1 Tax=Microbulbifer sp. THAF38 TaxID=2587856 RepID=UPI0012683823|nr:HNH endonuclease [Microbulbifer sp. THAF38]QFT53086.1 hypothetical protein FIU95_00630 [Microbulbifer sp. THAF38]